MDVLTRLVYQFAQYQYIFILSSDDFTTPQTKKKNWHHITIQFGLFDLWNNQLAHNVYLYEGLPHAQCLYVANIANESTTITAAAAVAYADFYAFRIVWNNHS